MGADPNLGSDYRYHGNLLAQILEGIHAYIGDEVVQEIVDLLISAGADVNCNIGTWWSPLSCCIVSRPLLAPFLLERGAKVPDTGARELMLAIEMGHLSIVKTLCERFPIDLNSRIEMYRFPCTPLEKAVFLRELNVVKLLVKLGATVTRELITNFVPSHTREWNAENMRPIVLFLISQKYSWRSIPLRDTAQWQK